MSAFVPRPLTEIVLTMYPPPGPDAPPRVDCSYFRLDGRPVNVDDLRAMLAMALNSLCPLPDHATVTRGLPAPFAKES